MTKLGNICKFQSGGTPAKGESAYYGGKIPWITTVALNGGMIGNESAIEWITLKALRESAAKLVPAFSIMIGTRVGVGKVAINREEMSTSQDIISLIGINDARWSKPYICRFLQAKSDFLNAQARGATIKGIKIEVLSELDIPEITLVEQQRIAYVFDNISTLILKKQEQLRQMDLLIKSRFVEMFGDADLAQTRPEWRSVSEIGTVVGGATPKTTNDEFWDGLYRWITPAELENESGYIFDSVRKITEAGVKSCALTELPVGTVILSSRAPIGKVAIAGNTFYCNQGFKNIICNQDINPVFLYSLLRMNTRYLNSLGRGATFKEISKAIVENIRIPVPPRMHQDRFAAFVAEVDKSKLAVKQSLEKLETLKKSLMQQYFG